MLGDGAYAKRRGCARRRGARSEEGVDGTLVPGGSTPRGERRLLEVVFCSQPCCRNQFGRPCQQKVRSMPGSLGKLSMHEIGSKIPPSPPSAVILYFGTTRMLFGAWSRRDDRNGSTSYHNGKVGYPAVTAAPPWQQRSGFRVAGPFSRHVVRRLLPLGARRQDRNLSAITASLMYGRPKNRP